MFVRNPERRGNTLHQVHTILAWPLSSNLSRVFALFERLGGSEEIISNPKSGKHC